MDLRTDSVEDILCHYGISEGSGHAYLGEILSHTGDTKIRQREAYGRLVDALIEKASKQLEEMKAINKSVWKIQDAIAGKTNEDKNANVNGLLQRKRTYLARQTAKHNELNATIAEAKDKLEKMKYSSLDLLRGQVADEKTDRLAKLNTIVAEAKTLKIFPR